MPPTSGSTLAVSFDGTDDGYVGPQVTTVIDNFGIEAWVKPAASSVSPQLIVHNGAPFNGDGYGLEILNGRYHGEFGFFATPFDIGVAATPGVWRHLALVRDGGVTRVYIDGAVVYQNSPAAPGIPNGASAIGRAPGGGAYFTGAVDDVRIFTFAPGTFNPQDLAITTPASGAWSWAYTTDDGPAQSQEVTITASTGVSGDTTSLPFTLIVTNVAPTASLSNGGAVSEGSAGSVSFSSPSDPSTADTTAGFHYAYDFDNDGTFEVGDGTYAGSGTATSATVPASFLADGPGTLIVRGRIIDKDDGFTDDTTTLAIANVVPTAAVSGPAEALTSQVSTFLLRATDASPSDQAVGFTYAVTWGDGSPVQTISPVVGTGDATARHAYAATGTYTIHVTATDQNGGSSPPTGTTITITSLTTTSAQATIHAVGASVPPARASPLSSELAPAEEDELQDVLAGNIELAPVDDAALHEITATINALAPPDSPVEITIRLGDGPYSGVTLSPPAGITLLLAGTDTSDTDGTQISSATGPAVTVTRGEVVVQGAVLSTTADAPTILVTGGLLTVAQDWIDESTAFTTAAIEVTGGGVRYGFDVVTNINGAGSFFRAPQREAIAFPEGIDDFLIPNMFAVDGVYGAASHQSATTLLRVPPAESGIDQAVTFTALIDTRVEEVGYATGTVTFYDGETLLATVPLQTLQGAAQATFMTSSLSVGEHTIAAFYSGDDRFVASSAALTHHVQDNHAPVAVDDAYTTAPNTALTIAVPGVLGNDSDADGDPLTAESYNPPAHGTVTLNANGSFTYTPTSGYFGGDSFSYTTTDGALDSQVATVTLAVIYPFAGFFAPVDNPPTFNPVNAGQTVAFKFSLGGNRGLIIIAAGYPVSQPIDCSTGAPIGVVQPTTASTPLSYDATSTRYTYTWKTVSTWAGTCRQFTLRLADGIEHLARFTFH